MLQQQNLLLTKELAHLREAQEQASPELQAVYAQLTDERLAWTKDRAALEAEHAARLAQHTADAHESASTLAIAQGKIEQYTERVGLLEQNLRESETKSAGLIKTLEQELVEQKVALSSAVREKERDADRAQELNESESMKWAQERISILAEHASMVAALESKLQCGEHEHELLKGALAAEERITAELRSKQSESRVKGLDVQRSMEAQLEQRSEQLEEVRIQLAKANQQISQSSVLEGVTQRELAASKLSLKQAEAHIESQEAQLAQAVSTLNSHKMKAAALELQLEDAKHRASKAAPAEAVASECFQLRLELAAQHERVATLEPQVLQTKQTEIELQLCRREMEHAVSELSQMREKVTKYEEQLRTVTKAENSHIVQIESLERTLELESRKKEELQAEVISLRNSEARGTQALDISIQSQERLRKAEAELSARDVEVAELQHQLESFKTSTFDTIWHPSKQPGSPDKSVNEPKSVSGDTGMSGLDLKAIHAATTDPSPEEPKRVEDQIQDKAEDAESARVPTRTLRRRGSLRETVKCFGGRYKTRLECGAVSPRAALLNDNTTSAD